MPIPGQIFIESKFELPRAQDAPGIRPLELVGGLPGVASCTCTETLPASRTVEAPWQPEKIVNVTFEVGREALGRNVLDGAIQNMREVLAKHVLHKFTGYDNHEHCRPEKRLMTCHVITLTKRYGFLAL